MPDEIEEAEKTDLAIAELEISAERKGIVQVYTKDLVTVLAAARQAKELREAAQEWLDAFEALQTAGEWTDTPRCLKARIALRAALKEPTQQEERK